MSDYANVQFRALHHVFHVPSVLADFHIGSAEFTIRWYGVLIAVGFLLGLWACIRLCRRQKINVDVFLDEVIWGTIFGILGARLYYVLFSWDYYKLHPDEIWRIHDGGLAIYGGVIAALLTVIVVSKIKKASILEMFDLASVGFLVGQGIGRWGNFANQEAFGTNTSLPWGMTSEKVRAYIVSRQWFFEAHHISMNPAEYVHPTFLYESIWCLLGFVLLYIMFKKHRKYRGQIFLMYGAWYGFERAIVEGLRTDSLYVGQSDVRISQWLSALVCAACVVLLIIQAVRYRGKPVLAPYTDWTPALKRTEKGAKHHDAEDHTVDQNTAEPVEQIGKRQG